MGESVFASIISLKRSIERLLNSRDGSLVPSCREILEFAYEEAESLVKIAERTLWRWSWRMWDSDSKIREEITEAVSKFDEAIRSHVSNQIGSQFESRGDRIRSPIDAQAIKQDIQHFNRWVKEMIEALYYRLPEDSSSTIDSGGKKSKFVRLSDQYFDLKEKLISGGPTKSKVIALVGMPGIGKTTFAKDIYEDPDIVKHFDCRVWVTVGIKCQAEEIQQHILAQLNPICDKMLAEGRHISIGMELNQILKDKRYLIVLDDVWDKYMIHGYWYFNQPSYANPFWVGKEGSRVLLTTRLRQVNRQNCQLRDGVLTMRLLNKEESWDLLRERVFPEELCPPQLEKVGKKIVEHCDGLPLTIITVADHLSKAEKSLEYWSEIAAQKNHKLFMTAYDEISEVLLPSYKFLPRILQMCFLYMGVFPQNHEITRSKLIRMWNVDGFPELNARSSHFPGGMECLGELVSNSLVMTYPITVDPTSLVSHGQIKTCRLHSSFWHLSNREARKIKFSNVLNNRGDGLGEGSKSQRRLSFHNNILFAIKDVCKSVGDNCASTTHSLLCYGSYHQYQVPIFFGLGLLEQLDALTICFYEFPIEVLQLVRLRYLALTMNGKLPASISRLSNLEFLIVHRHLSIKSYGDPSYLPIEIWNMKQLQHLEVMGSNLPNPSDDSLKRLSTLLNVSGHSCESFGKAIPNLEKLGIQIELAPDDDGQPLNYFNHISRLKALKSLKCVILNPEVTHPLDPISILPKFLTKLSLSGLGYPWKEMSKIASLWVLRVLKLRNYAFRGSKWTVEEKGFPSLMSLIIQDTDLVEWEIGHESFRHLDYLSMKDCYKLEKIHTSAEMNFLEKIELIECNPLGVRQMKKVVPPRVEVSVSYSWYDGKLKT